MKTFNGEQNRKIYLYAIATCIILAGGLLIYNDLQPTVAGESSEPSTDHKIHVTRNLTGNINTYLHLQRFDSAGRLKGELWKPDDLLLSNYCNWTLMTLSGRTAKAILKDDQGQSSAVGKKESATTDSYIAIGNGSTAAAFSDYKLETETHREVIDDWLLETSGTSYNLTVTAFFTFASDYNITEAGWCVYQSDLGDEVFLTRDTFTQQTMETNDTLSVSVIMEFSGGITDNFGQLIANAYYGGSPTYNIRPTLKSGEDHHGIELYIWDDQEDGYGDKKDWEMAVGTSSSAFALDDYSLGNEVYLDAINDDDQVIWDNSGSDCNVTVIGYFSADGTYNLYEIGLLTPISEQYVSCQILICREVLSSPYAVDSGDNIAVYVTWVIDQP